MINEKDIAFRYLGAQKKRTVLLIFGVVLAIALISTLFSVLNEIQQYEVRMESSQNGVWHIEADNCTQKQADELARRLDVSAIGRLISVSAPASFGGKVQGDFKGCDANGVNQLDLTLKDGKLPQNDNQIALEQWATDKVKKGAQIGDIIKIKFGSVAKSYRISGFFNDVSMHKGYASYIAVGTLNEAQRLNNTSKVSVLMQVKDGIDIDQFVKGIEKDQHIGKNSVVQHNVLLAALGRSNSGTAWQFYLIGGFLALLVIISSIIMINNAFNISVTQRVRQFGLLRAMGATPKQIRKIVRSEALLVSLLGVLPGLLLGVIVSSVLVWFLSFVMPEYFVSSGSLICFSWISLVIGAATGILSTVFSSIAPARKAGKISPVEAMASVSGKAIRKKTANGIATKVIPVEFALSLRRLLTNKRSFIMTSISLSFGILLLLSFSAVTGMLTEGVSHNHEMGDIYVAAKAQNRGFSDNFIRSLAKTGGVDGVSAERIASVDATFDYSLLGSEYRQGRQKVKKDSGGKVLEPSKSTIIGLSDNALTAMNGNLIFGRIDPQQLNAETGVILMLNNEGRVNVSDLRPGDFIYINHKKMKICGIIKENYTAFSYTTKNFIGIFTTNKIFNGFSSIKPNLITMTLKNGADSDRVYSQVKRLTAGNKNMQTGNQHDTIVLSDKIMLIAYVFIYGFVAVIAVIGILNIINTMSTNVLVRMREIGLLRAAGMTMGQVSAMVAGEAVLYGILSLIIGLAAGIPFEHLCFDWTVKSIYSIPWSMPWNLIVVSSLITFAAILLSIFSPLRYIKKIEITQAVTVE